jgi:hypothetical protein
MEPESERLVEKRIRAVKAANEGEPQKPFPGAPLDIGLCLTTQWRSLFPGSLYRCRMETGDLKILSQLRNFRHAKKN